MKKILLAIFLLYTGNVYTQPVPTPQQLAWHDMEFYLFAHFGPNTFTGLEWGHGNEKEELFNPRQLDCEQWCRVAKAAGAKGIIITAKHHDGFCLWPSKYSKHTVRESKWKNGKGDVLKELSAACKKYDLRFGVYLSPWDRNHPKYGMPAYNDVFANMLKEVFSNYGPIWELWWDGANGEGPDGKKQVYDFRRFEKLVRKLSPQTVIFSDIGPDIRWVGNESGFAGTTNWNYLDTAGFKRGAGAPPQDTLTTGNRYGKYWIPAECDVSIRPGWFWHKEENDKVKTPQQLFDLYLKSIGRGANLLLNVPPDTNGLIHPADSAALAGFAALKQNVFKKNLIAGKATEGQLSGHGAYTGILFPEPVTLNCIVLKEDIKKGQFCDEFTITLLDEKMELLQEIKGTTIGHKRIITFPQARATHVIVKLGKQAREKTVVSSIEAYFIKE